MGPVTVEFHHEHVKIASIALVDQVSGGCIAGHEDIPGCVHLRHGQHSTGLYFE